MRYSRGDIVKFKIGTNEIDKGEVKFMKTVTKALCI